MLGCVRPGIQSEDQNQFFAFKVRTFWQSKVKISFLALWLCALSSLFHNMGVGGYGHNPLFVRARHVQRCVKKMSSLWMCCTQICPRFECRDEHIIHTCVYCVLTLNAGTGMGVCGSAWEVCVDGGVCMGGALKVIYLYGYMYPFSTILMGTRLACGDKTQVP